MRLTRNIIRQAALLITLGFLSVGYASEANLQVGIEEVLGQEGLTGIAWVLLDGNGEMTTGSGGVRDNETGAQFTADTSFHVGSVTKSLLATGILRLATTGLIDLDAPVSRYLPRLPFDNPWHGQSSVTTRHLLDHTSGLDDARLWQMFSQRPEPDALLIDAFPEPEKLLRIRSRPGSRFSYSNMGYTVLGLVIESLTGDRYEAYLDRQLLAPLGMHDSTFEFTTQEGANADPRLAWGHVDDGSRYAASPVFLRPAAQFTTTAKDLGRFAAFLLSDGVIDGQSFIDIELMQARGRPTGTEAADHGLLAGYALGLGRRDRHGVIGFCHGGNIVGFVAMLCIYPDENKAFAYSVNTDSESADYGRIDRLLIEALSIRPAATPPTAEPDPAIAQWHGRYVLNPNRFEMFSYLDTVFGAVEISGPPDMLTLKPLQQDARQLRPLGKRVFSANDRATASHVFLRGADGGFLISDGFRTYEKVPTAYLAAHWASILLGMAGAAWLLLAGLVSLLRYRSQALQRIVTPAFSGLLLLLLPLPFFLIQPFMALGDLTIASALLMLVTLLLPLAMLITLLRARKNREHSRLAFLHGLAAVLVLQWCAVLSGAGLLPLRLWV